MYCLWCPNLGLHSCLFKAKHYSYINSSIYYSNGNLWVMLHHKGGGGVLAELSGLSYFVFVYSSILSEYLLNLKDVVGTNTKKTNVSM